MNIWLIHLGELLPIDGDVRLFRYGILAEMLAERGHHVTRWAPTFVHATKTQRAENDKTIRLDRNRIIELLYAEGYQKHVGFSRWRFHRQVAQAFSHCSSFKSKPDVILSAMPTPETCMEAIKYGQYQNVPVVIDIRDLWPDIYLDIFPRYLRSFVRLLMFPLFRMNRRIFKKASGIVGISKSYLRWGLDYAGRSKEARDRVFYMGYKKQKVSLEQRRKIEDRWLQRGVKRNKFICCFFGTIGRQFDLETIINAARYFEGYDEDKQFIICGDGENLEHYKSQAADLKSVIFPGWVETTDIAVLMDWAEVGLAPYNREARMSLPNKPFEYFSGGLPVVSSLKGELEMILKQNNCGINYKAGQVEDFVQIIRYLQKNPGERKQMGKNAKRLYEEKYSADRVYTKMIDYLEQIAYDESIKEN
jgi:glycosyltransferase involved in cell wall biosynthesis